MKDYKLALKYRKLGHKVYNENKNDGRNNSYFLANIGDIFYELGQTDSAIFYFNKSYEQAKRINNEHRIAIAEYHLGKVHFELGNTNLAKEFLTNSHKTAVKGNYLDLLRDCKFLLSEIEELKGNAEAALVYFKEATALKDSLFNKDEISRFTEITIQLIQEKEAYEKSLLQENIEIQKISIRKGKILRWLLLAVGFLLLIVLFYIARSRESTKKLNAKLQKSERKIKQSNATKDKFFSILAHDLKSPLAGIVGWSKVLVKDTKLADEDFKKYIQIIHDSSVKTFSLLENVLTWAQSQKGELKFNAEQFNIGFLVNETAALYKEKLRNKKIELTVDLNTDVSVCADINMVKTVLRNLISNAIKFTNTGGSIELVTRLIHKDGEFVEISVKDNGVGISPKVQSKLFNVAENLTTPGTENESGTGLGLVLCSEFVQKNKGEIGLESEEGKGSVFYFTLPVKC